MTDNKKTKEKGKTLKSRNREQLIFCILTLIYPVAQFLVFYVFVNFKSILFSFQDYDFLTSTYHWNGLENFKQVFANFGSTGYLATALKNSLVLFVWNIGIGTGFGLLFSYYIYKKFFFSEFFRVMLFLPHIISAVVMVIIYRYAIDAAFPEIVKKLFGIKMGGILNGDKAFGYVLFFSLFTGFGTNVLMYTSAMSGIDTSIVESAELDGVTPFKEFIFISLPLVYPTVVTFLIVSIAGIFSNQMNLYSFYEGGASTKMYNVGYYLYTKAKEATNADYTYLSSFGLLCTLVVVPLTLGIKRLLFKFGPSVD